MEYQDKNDKPTPVIFDHCVAVYKKMLESATMERLHEDDEEEVLVYEGHLTKLFQILRLSMPYYSQVTKYLKKMNCVTQLRRGGGNAKSKWMLIREPDEETFHAVINTKSARDGWRAAVDQQMRSLNMRVGRLEEATGLSETEKEAS